MIEFSKPIHQTRILPLRWFAHMCESIASHHLLKAVYLDEALDVNLSLRYKYHAKMWNIFYKPYKKWGTTYEVDMDAWRKSIWGEGIDPDAIDKLRDAMDKLRSDEVLDKLGSDYDEDGVAYWEK